jgi:hypothetical protein
MLAHHFMMECEKRGIAPSIALEDDEVRTALEDRDDDAVIAALDNNF